MKKLTALALLMAMCMSLFAGCTQKAPDPTPTPEPPAVEESGLSDAVAYLKNIYKKAEGTVTGKDYEVVGVVPVGEKKFEITWSVDVGEDKVTIVPNDSGMVTIDVNEGNGEELTYVLTATLTDGTDTESLSWSHILPAAVDIDGMPYSKVLDLAYALEDGQALESACSLFGTVTSIDTEWSDEYGNITVTIAVSGHEDRPVQCYRLTGEGAKDLKVGDAITVNGIIKNYKGTIEFDKGCVLVGYGEHPDQSALLKAAFSLAEGAQMDFTTVLTGTVDAIPTAWSDEYNNITINIAVGDQIVQAYRLSGEGAKDLKEGDTVTVAGIIKNYKGTVEFDAGCKLIPNDAYSSVKVALSGYRLQEGEAQDTAKTLTGTIVAIPTEYSADYKNITVNLVVAGLEDYVVQCYRLAGEGAENLAVGDTITVTGTLKNYKGTVEFDAGCTLDAVH